MVKEHALVTRASPWVLALAAATLTLFRSMPVAIAAEQQSIVIHNTSMCGVIDVDGKVEDGGCLAIAQALPQLEGFEMASELGTAVSKLRGNSYKSLADKARDPS